MSKLKFAALAAGLLLQSLAYPANAPSHDPVMGNVGSVPLNHDRAASGRADESRDYSPLPVINDIRAEECNPEDDCPRPPSSQRM
jgi:hypothetical protein